MIVCICMDVNEQTISTAINDGFNTTDLLTQELDVIKSCSYCEDLIQEMVDNHT